MEFCPDEDAFLAWRSLHPEGQVLLVSESPDQPGVITHRASCEELSRAARASGAGRAPTAWACFESPTELLDWSSAYLSVVPSGCPTCLAPTADSH